MTHKVEGLKSEELLVEEAREGSEQAFTSLVRLYQGRVRAYLGRHIRDFSVVDDLAQEVFFTAYRSFSTFEGEGLLGTWLVGIARNRALVYLRGEARRRARDSSSRLEGALAQWRAEALELAPSDAGREGHGVSALRDCVGHLPEKSAAMIQWHYFEGLSSVTIGRRMGKDGGVVRVTLRRLRHALRQCVQQKLAMEGL